MLSWDRERADDTESSTMEIAVLGHSDPANMDKGEIPEANPSLLPAASAIDQPTKHSQSPPPLAPLHALRGGGHAPPHWPLEKPCHCKESVGPEAPRESSSSSQNKGQKIGALGTRTQQTMQGTERVQYTQGFSLGENLKTP